MVDWKASTRKIVAVVGSSADRAKGTGTVILEDQEGRHLSIVFGAAAIPATIGILVSLLNDLIGDMDDPLRPEMQTLQASHLHVGRNEDGEFALLIGLQGATELPVKCDREQVATLKTELEEALSSSDPRVRH